MIKKNTAKCSIYCCTKINNFNVTLGNTEILKNINLHIHCGDLTCIIGPNGAGKSTLLKSILGQVKHTGTLTFIDSKNEKSINPIIGYVPQYLDFDKNTPLSVLDFFCINKTIFPIWMLNTKKYYNEILSNLSRVNSSHLIDKKLGSLSGGELQRVLLALSLDPIPNILLLDEPVSGIDQNGLKLFYEILVDIKSKFDLSIILVSHDLDLVSKYADKVILINKTVLCSGTPSQVFNNIETKNAFRLNYNRNDDNIAEGGNLF